ncbi:MAG: spore germination protein [Syntrophomonadaceae bacterium]|nr:spore germination protein [Syntrophomonadaceae bacterium]
MFKKDKHIYLDKDYSKNVEFLKKELGAGESFDVIFREFRIAGRKAVLICIDGFVKDEALIYIMQSLYEIRKEGSLFNDVKKLLKVRIPYIELSTESKIDELLYFVLSGSILLIVDGIEEAFVIDARTYPARDPDEPELERVVRGSRDGFTETIVFNTALIRRRVRDPKLRVKLLQVGKRSKSDICVCYINDIADPELVKNIIDRIENIEIDAIPMAEKSVEELITPGSFWNPFPKVRYTERPDVAATHLFEGHVLIIVDTSPSVIIAPATYFHHVQHAEEYRQNPTVGVYIRWVRFIAIVASVILTPLWLLFALSPEYLPESLKFIGPEKVGKIPLLLQFLIAEISIDLMRMAAIHTPSPLATALGVIAALLIGDIAVNIGLLIPEVIIYTAVVAVGAFSTPSYEMSMANRLARLFILLSTGLFRLPGFIVSLGLVILLLSITKSFGIPYLWPLIPFNYRALKSILIRSPVPIQNIRPEALNPQDSSRQPVPALKRRRE